MGGNFGIDGERVEQYRHVARINRIKLGSGHLGFGQHKEHGMLIEIQNPVLR
jgi:hypothetical protein